MIEILTRAGCYLAIIVLGWLLRKVGFFGPETFGVLSKITLKITLPAAIISGFAGKVLDPAMVTLSLIGLGGGLLYVALGYLMGKKGGRDRQAFYMLNLAGCNVGNFTLPFVQGFLGPTAVIATSLFDLGNSCICLGTSYSLAAMVKDGGGFSWKKLLKALSRSVPFLTYVVMTAMSLVKIPVPGPVAELAGIIGGGNAFIAMLMIGVGFRLSGDASQIGRIVKLLAVRYGVALLLAVGCWFLLPFGAEVRTAVVVLVLGPIASAAPAFTGELEGDVGLASAVNSISILCSIVAIVTALIVLL